MRALAIAAAMITAFLPQMNAQPELVHLSLQGKPGQSHSPVIVTWCSKGSAGNQYVRSGVFPDLESRVKANSSVFHDRFVMSAKLRRLHPGIKYFYKTGSDEAGWSPIYSFVTEPDTGSFRVGVIADTQNNTGNEEFGTSKAVTEMLKLYSPSLVLHMGDMVNNGSETASWEKFLKSTLDLNSSAPVMPALGNHDVNNDQGSDFQKPFDDFRKLFNLPGNEIDYSYNYENVHFVVLFSGCAEAASKSGLVRYKPGSPEYKWLDRDLSGAEKNKNIKWIIVYMHYPLYSSGWSNINQWKESVLPLIERHRVDLCLAGHRHIYERHFQLRDGVPVSRDRTAPVQAGNGTLFITNGTAGGNPTGPGGRDLPTMAYTQDRTMFTFAVMDISGRAINYRVFDKDNLLIDSFVIRR